MTVIGALLCLAFSLIMLTRVLRARRVAAVARSGDLVTATVGRLRLDKRQDLWLELDLPINGHTVRERVRIQHGRVVDRLVGVSHLEAVVDPTDTSRIAVPLLHDFTFAQPLDQRPDEYFGEEPLADLALQQAFELPLYSTSSRSGEPVANLHVDPKRGLSLRAGAPDGSVELEWRHAGALLSAQVASDTLCAVCLTARAADRRTIRVRALLPMDCVSRRVPTAREPGSWLAEADFWRLWDATRAAMAALGREPPAGLRRPPPRSEA